MYQIFFTPKEKFADIIKAFSPEEKDKLGDLLIALVAQVFPQIISYRQERNASEVYSVRVNGIAVLGPPGAAAMVANDIHLELSRSSLGNLFRIELAQFNLVNGDLVHDPSQKISRPTNSNLQTMFNIPDESIPERFLCTITHELITRAAFLTTNPRAHYELATLRKWVIEHKNDPTTRAVVNIGDIRENTILQSEINEFLENAILGLPLEKYHHPKKDMETQTELESQKSASASASNVGVFSRSEIHENELEELCKKYFMRDKWIKLGGELLRAAARVNDTEDIQKLFGQYGVEVLRDQDDKFRQTAGHVAAECGNREAIELLIELGVSLDLRDNHGHNIRDYQLEWSHRRAASGAR